MVVAPSSRSDETRSPLPGQVPPLLFNVEGILLLFARTRKVFPGRSLIDLPRGLEGSQCNIERSMATENGPRELPSANTCWRGTARRCTRTSRLDRVHTGRYGLSRPEMPP